jgi:hypothetical protein
MYGQIGLLRCVPQFVDEQVFVRSDDICSAIKGSRCALNLKQHRRLALAPEQRFEVHRFFTTTGGDFFVAVPIRDRLSEVAMSLHDMLDSEKPSEVPCRERLQ